MFDKLKAFFAGEEEVIETTDPDIRRAVAALLVHAAHIDGHTDYEELAVRDKLLKQKFDLADAEIANLVMQAEKAEAESTDLYRFTHQLKEHYDRDKRGRIVEMLWEIVLADGVIDEQESHLVWRVAGLLGFTTRENGDFRRNVQARL